MPGQSLRVTTPIEFAEGQAVLSTDDMVLLSGWAACCRVIKTEPVIRVLVSDPRDPAAAELLAPARCGYGSLPS